jgi:methyl-accepting chemotaxis protein
MSMAQCPPWSERHSVGHDHRLQRVRRLLAVEGLEADPELRRLTALAALQTINALIDCVEQGPHVQNEVALKAARSFALETWLATGAAFALALWVSGWVVRGVLRELGTEPAALREITERMGSGDLATPIPLGRARPHSLLAALVVQERDAAGEMASGSTQIASGNADLSNRTELTAANLQQTSASMQQLAGSVASNADTAQTANQVAQAASQVATEVRQLAQRSAVAAREIKALISASVEQIDAGSQRVGDAGRSMGAIVEQVRRASDLIGEISTHSQEQKQGIGEVNQAVHQLDEVTSANAARVEQSAAAAASLREQAEQLARRVAQFKLA